MVNLKTYPEATGRGAERLARAAARLEADTGVPIALCVQAVDVRPCVAAGARVLAQHFDRLDGPQTTGGTNWPALAEAGCAGSLVNHSEKRVPPRDIPWHLAEVRSRGGVSILCTRTSIESARYARFGPDLLAVEPPQLIGGDVSVTTADPGVVRRTVAAVHHTKPGLPVLCGAGVKTADDVAAALRLGSYGILVASGVTRAPRPEAVLQTLAAPFAERNAATLKRRDRPRHR